MAENAQLLVATALHYFKGFQDATIKKRLWLSLLKKYGLIEYGVTGHTHVWDVMYSQPAMSQLGDGEDLTFTNHEAYRQLTCGVRGYKLTDMMTEKQKLMNSGEEAIVRLYTQKSKNLEKSAEDKFGKEIYTDGGAAANANRFEGLETLFGAGTCTVADLIAANNDTYGGQSTVPAALGGTWSADMATKPNASLATDFPYGDGSSEYAWNSPFLINTGSTNWPSGQNTWAANWMAVLRRAKTWSQRNLGEKNIPMLHMLGSEMVDQAKDSQEPSMRIIVPHKESQELGFNDVINFEGAGLYHEFGCPANTGYGFNPGGCELFFTTPKMWMVQGPEWDIKSMAYLYLLYTYGNFKWRPAHQCKYYPYATA